MSLNRLKTTFILILAFASSLNAQISGKKAFAFLNMNPSARQVSCFTNFLATVDKDLSQSWNNPAALNPLMHQQLAVSYNNYVSDINAGYFAYCRDYKKAGTFALSVLYVDYGKFDGYLPSGVSTGTFTVKDQCFNIAYGRPLNDKIRIGANLKYVYSIYESYVSNGISTDFSAIYNDTAHMLTMAAYARNLGIQAIPYSGTERQRLPLEVAFSISKRMAHLPFRYHFIFNNLQKPDLRYTISQTGEKDENGDPKVKTMSMADNVLRHLAFAGEFNFSKNFVVRFGYNHNKRREMQQEQRRGVAGFSWGLGMKISKFIFSYGSSSLFPGQNLNQFSLSACLNDFYKSK